MIDYVKEEVWNKMKRVSSDVWKNNLETIIQWSPYYSEADLLQQFNLMDDQGTRIIIYNLWDDDQGELELDFDADKHDIQVRGVNRDDKKIQMAKQFPNLRHFLTYRHSLRSYASILYLKLPHGFRIILRGKEIEHHNIVNDMMLRQEVTYRPQSGPDGVPKDMVAVVTIGFVKDAKDHIDVQGFNVYHKNRLIKPFWRVWNAAGSDGRGVIGVIEANFIEPAHDKQGFERTIVLSRLEARLLQMQKTYWRDNCHKVGYAPRRDKKLTDDLQDGEISPETPLQPSFRCSKKDFFSRGKTPQISQTQVSISNGKHHATSNQIGKEAKCSPIEEAISDEKAGVHSLAARSNLKVSDGIGRCSGNGPPSKRFQLLTDENKSLRIRLRELEETMLFNLQTEKDKNISLSEQLSALERQIEEVNSEQEALINIFQEERSRRDAEEENLRNKLKEASATIQQLVEKIHSEQTPKPEP